MTPREPVDSIDIYQANAAIDDAASRMTSATPSDALRANVMSRIAVERPSRFAWRLVFAGGAVASIALVVLVSWQRNSTIPNPTISTPAVINPTAINSAANPTAAVTDPSPVASVVRAAQVDRVAQMTPSAAELEWRARATPALKQLDPLEVKSLELKSIDISPLGVAPLVVPAVGDGSNR